MSKKYFGNSVSVFKVHKLCENFKKEDIFDVSSEINISKSNLLFSIESQKELTDYAPFQKSFLVKKTEILKSSLFIKNSKCFKVKMFSDPVHKKIKINWENFEEGYKFFDEFQEEQVFDIVFDDSFNYLYLFANKHTSNQFIKRLRDEEKIIADSVSFDFSLIKGLGDKLISAWGYWETGQGDIRRMAGFGIDVNESIKDFDKVTTLYIDYKLFLDESNEDFEEIQLTLSKEGRISTQSKYVDQKEILNIFKELYLILKK